MTCSGFQELGLEIPKSLDNLDQSYSISLVN